MKFKYLAKGSGGKTVRGMFDATDRKSAIEILRKEQVIIVSLDEVKDTFFLTKFGKLFQRVTTEDIVVFSRQLATVVEAGVPLVNALDIICEQLEKPELKVRVQRIRDEVEAGSSLSEALTHEKDFVSPFFINMVKAGETSGTLDEILDRVANYLEKTSSLQKKVSSAMIYPAVVSFMAIAVTAVLLIKVIPVFKEIYSGFGSKLPRPTEILIGISDFLSHNIIIMLIIIGALMAALSWVSKTKKGAFYIDKLKLSLPIFGPLLRKVAVTKFTRTFSTLVRSGVPIISALDIVGKTAGNVIIEQAVDDIKTNIKEGENISGPLAKSKVFPPLVVRMIGIGEKTGELEKMLTKVSDFYDDEVDATVSGLSSLIEPLIIAFLGIVIGGIVICMFLPILQISQILNSN